MAAKKTMNALDFAREYLRKKPDAPYADIRDAAQKKNLVLYPISYGRAQALEGIVKSAPYGSKKKRKRKSKETTAAAAGSGTTVAKRGPGRPKGSKNKVKAGPGRPRKATRGSGIDNLVETIQNLQNERDEAREVLEQIRGLLARR
jgi:hypothetical protein